MSAAIDINAAVPVLVELLKLGQTVLANRQPSSATSVEEQVAEIRAIRADIRAFPRGLVAPPADAAAEDIVVDDDDDEADPP